MKKLIVYVLVLALSAISLVALESIAPHLVLRQALFFIIGLLVMLAISYSRFENWSFLSTWLYWGMNLLLLGLLVFGQSTRGTVGWISLTQGFKFQPSQYAILTTALFIAFHLKKLDLKKIKDFLQLLAWILLPGLLILLEPDIGTGMIYLASMSVVLLAAKIPGRFLLGLMGAGVVSLFLVWSLALNLQRRQRITSFFSGYQQDQSSASYNARQALIAIGSGKVFGRGLGFGVQSHLKFLPERQTDFIFASLAEEWGFVGSLIVILIYLSLCVYLIVLSGQQQKKGQQVFVLIMTAMLMIQTGVNIGMNLGLTPITGITLPLLSYGGSSVIAILMSLGFIQSLNSRQIKSKVKEIS